MNAPDVDEWLDLPAGLKRISVTADTKLSNASNFRIEREGHTIGNLIRMQILRDDRVLFGGYKVPHPLEYHVLVKIQTNSSSTPFMTMQQALDDVKSEFEDIRTSFSQQLDRSSRYQ